MIAEMCHSSAHQPQVFREEQIRPQMSNLHFCVPAVNRFINLAQQDYKVSR